MAYEYNLLVMFFITILIDCHGEQMNESLSRISSPDLWVEA